MHSRRNMEDPISNYRAIQYRSVRLGFGTVLIYAPATALRVVVRSDLKRILNHCHDADSLEGLCVRAARLLNLSEDRHPFVRQSIQELVSLGLIVPEGLVPSSAPVAETATSAITSFAIVTANRPRECKRAFTSFADNLRTHGRHVRVIVMDDSDPACRETYVQTLAEAGTGLEIRYAGRLEKESYIAALISQGIGPDVARFALLGELSALSCTTGANRNALLLDTIGENVISADDDTTCKFAIHPCRDDKLCFGEGGDPREKWFYSGRDQLQEEVTWVEADFIGEHERLLDRPVLRIASAKGEIDAVHGNCPSRFHPSRSQARVAITMSGVAGDSGTYSANALLRSTGATQQRLSSSEEMFRCAQQSREVLSVVPARTVTDHPFCMAYLLGMANAGTLPPFFPIGRNQDGIFGALLRLSTVNAIGHIPLAVLHDPPSKRPYQEFPECRISDMVLCLIAWLVGPAGNEPPRSLRFLGQGLVDISRLDDSDFWDVLFQAVSKQSAERLRSTERSMKRLSECPEYWRSEVERFYEHTAASLRNVNCCIPVEFSQGRDLHEARCATREMVKMAGRLFLEWFDLIDASRLLSQRGRRISVAISEARKVVRR
jgi:hypothetical protein